MAFQYTSLLVTVLISLIVTDQRVATNHQEHVEWHRHARATATVERERFLLQRLTLHDEPANRFIGAFQRPHSIQQRLAGDLAPSIRQCTGRDVVRQNIIGQGCSGHSL